FAVLGSLLQVITPEPGLGLECHLVLRTGAEIAFLAVDVSRYPIARDQVQAPAIHVEKVSVARTRLISTKQSHNVVILVFDPDSATERPLPVPFLADTSKTKQRTSPRNSRCTNLKS